MISVLHQFFTWKDYGIFSDTFVTHNCSLLSLNVIVIFIVLVTSNRKVERSKCSKAEVFLKYSSRTYPPFFEKTFLLSKKSFSLNFSLEKFNFKNISFHFLPQVETSVVITFCFCWFVLSWETFHHLWWKTFSSKG